MKAVISKLTGSFLEYRECIHCKEETLKEMLTMVKSGDWVCVSCLYKYYTRCNSCEEYDLDEFVRDIGNGSECLECREINGNNYE